MLRRSLNFDHWQAMASKCTCVLLWLLACINTYPRVAAAVLKAENPGPDIDKIMRPQTEHRALSSHSQIDGRDDGKYMDFQELQFLGGDYHLCPENAYVIIFVMSAATHEEPREAIRQSWGSVAGPPDSHVNVVFIVGVPAHNESRQTEGQLARESAKYRDILRINSLDSYKNLTLKSVAMLKWVTQRCPQVKYILKADDDTFVNTPLLMNDLQDIVHDRFFMGDVIAGAHPIRDQRSKYYTARTIFRGTTYPKYISGAAYLISGDIVASLYEAALQTKPFWLEDVFVTGLLGQKVQAKHVFNGKFSHRDKYLEPCQLRDRVIILHRVKPHELRNAWNLVMNPTLSCK